MTIREIYQGESTYKQLFAALSFIGFQPKLKIDTTHNTISTKDPHDKTTHILLDTKDLATSNGDITAGTVTEIHFFVKNKEAVTLTGLTLDATQLKNAIAGAASGLYDWVTNHLDGNLIAKGDKFDNLLEIGGGGKATVDGGDGNDQIEIWHPKDADIDGGKGVDTIEFSYFVGFYPQPAIGATVDLAAGTGTNPFGGTLKIHDVENITGQFGASNDLRGDEKANTLHGGTAADTLVGRGGNDQLYIKYSTTLDPRATMVDGGIGKDTLTAELSDSSAAPFTGSGETLRFINTLDLENSANNTGTFHGGTFTNLETYKASASGPYYVFHFFGSEKGEAAYGAGSEDVLDGRGGDDVLFGGYAADTLTGGGGADKFLYRFDSDSLIDSGGQDTITDFSHAEHDQIDLHLFFNKLDFIGEKKFDGKHAEVRFAHSGDQTTVYVDSDGDKVVDTTILLDHGPANMVEGDFVL